MALFEALQAVVIPVTNMARSQAFYRDVLELAPLHEDSGVSVYSTGNSELCLVLEDDAAAIEPTAYPNLRCADAAAVRAALTARGVSCSELAQSGPVTWFHFRDPDGNRLDCCEFTEAAY